MKSNDKYKGLSETRLKQHLLTDNYKNRPEIINELERQELAKDARLKWSYFIQWTILILTIIVVAFTISSFIKKPPSNIISKERKGFGGTNVNRIQSYKQNDTQKKIQENLKDKIHDK